MNNTSSQKTSTGDPVAQFFDELGRRGNEPLLRRLSGRIRFELVDGEQVESWLLTVDKGELTVTRETGPADATIRGDRSTFEELIAGRKNASAALLRGALTGRGDLELMAGIQRIFPDPPRGWDPTAKTRSAS